MERFQVKSSSAEPLFVLGTTLWSKRLAIQLEKTGRFDCRGVYELNLRGLSKLFALIRSRRLIRVGVRPGVMRPRGILADLLCALSSLMGIEVTVCWIGTDVLLTCEDYQEGRSRWQRFWVERCKAYRHTAGAPWLSEELAEIGINAETLYFPSPLEKREDVPAFPHDFSVLTYIPDGREDFYGGQAIYACAKSHPSIHFHVIAGNGVWVDDSLPNLTFHGWVDNIDNYYANSVVVVRLVKHDALGGTVREAWAQARYVIYSYPTDHARQVAHDDVEQLASTLEEWEQAFLNGNLDLNIAAREYALENFDEAVLAERYASWLVEGQGKQSERA